MGTKLTFLATVSEWYNVAMSMFLYSVPVLYLSLCSPSTDRDQVEVTILQVTMAFSLAKVM